MKKSVIILIIVISIILLYPKEQEVLKGSATKENYGILKIEKIDLELPFFKIDDPKNNVEYNIEVLKDEEGSLFIAGHSGVGKKAYFNDLSKLEIDDKINIKNNNIDYLYYIEDIYLEKKDGTISVSKNESESILVLTTCSQRKKGYQLVIKAVLQ